MKNNFGIHYEGEEPVISWRIETPGQNSFVESYNLAEITNLIGENTLIKVGPFFVAPMGPHNNLPLEIRDTINANPYMPELLEKQVRFLYGNGPFLYTENIIDGKKVKVPVFNTEIQNWLESWKKYGLKDFKFYLMDVAREFYYSEGIFNNYVFRKSRRIGGILPVVGLEYIPTKAARFATLNDEYFSAKTIDPKDFNYILKGDWLSMFENRYEVFNAMDFSRPFDYPRAVNYTKNGSYGEDLYSFLPWFLGLKEWINASNLNPKYINSFLKNSLAARLHVIIPYGWVQNKRELLQDICKRNQHLKEAGKEIQEYYMGVKVSTEFREEMVQQLINNKLRQITEMMSGEGKNQGKLFSSQSFLTDNGLEQWEFKEMPMNYKEYINTLIDVDKRAVDVILAGKGIDASISNVSKDGVISKSGADAYYNYLIYLNSLSIPEAVVTYDINQAIALNFPGTDVKLGFERPVVQRQEDVAPKNRMNKNVE